MPTEEEFAALKAAKKAAKLAKKRKSSDTAATPVAKTELPAAQAEAIDTWSSWWDGKGKPGSAPESTVASPVAASKSAPLDGPDGAALKDQSVSCIDCGAEFIFSAAEQKFFLEKGYTNGKSRCVECTRAKKQRFGEATPKGSGAAIRNAKATCKTCGEKGHVTASCPHAKCFNCGGLGHRSKDCPKPRSADAGICHKFQSGRCTRGDACRFAHVMKS